MTTDDETLDEEEGQEHPNIRQLREKAKRASDAEREAAEAKAELEAIKRENAFRKVGIDPEDAKAKWFAKAYDGEMSAEAISAAATEAGIIQPVEQTSADEQAAWSRTASAATGASADDQRPDVMQELHNAKSVEEITAIMQRHGHDVQNTGPLSDLLGYSPR